jgi:cytochrome b-561
MWIFGFLKIVPSQASFNLFGATIGPTFLGGVLFPALLFGLLTLTPWVDRTNRRVLRRFEYLEPVRQSPLRLASGVAMLVFIGSLFVAAYYDTLGLSLAQIWTIVLVVPLLAGVATWMVATHTTQAEWFDPHESLVSVPPQLVGLTPEPVPTRAPLLSPVMESSLDHSLLTQSGLDGP